MASVRQAASWFSRWLRRNPAAESDWGDLGTAFGLDRSLEPGHADAASPQAEAGRGTHRWWQRLGTRRDGIGH